jgi:hypothetical protein
MSNDASGLLEKKMFQLRKKLKDDDFIQELEAMSHDELRERIVQCELNIHDVERAVESDEELKKLSLKRKELSAPYAEAKKRQQFIERYCTCLLEQKGKV